jgi:hypothetical protein
MPGANFIYAARMLRVFHQCAAYAPRLLGMPNRQRSSRRVMLT